MFPSVPSVYPQFVADQLLTAHDLNELFGYLDEQGRMTRTNLIGIGIVCGLQVKFNTADNSITITKGVGVTSKGYLISIPETTYTQQKMYDKQLMDDVYDRFVNAGPPLSKKFDLWELKQESVDPDAVDITTGFLNDGTKIVMLFVELLQVGNKNCDPNSCDDKGKHYEVTIRPLLVRQNDATTLLGASGATVTAESFSGLAEIRMRRFDVPNTNPVSSEDIFDAYKSILSTGFLNSTETVLTQAYSVFSVFINNEYPTNPFSGLAGNFAFVNNGTITADQLKHIQYIYDLFSDFLQSYYEFRKTGMEIISACCPDENLFPRHLLLGEAIPLTNNVKSIYRHYFIYSPLFEHTNLLGELKSLFKRLVLLKEKFFIPPVNSGSPYASMDPNIRITPSLLQDVAFSKKAIPYYYNPVSGTNQLYRFWDFKKTMQGKPQFNLSYNVDQYNTTDDFITSPLKYDLEPYNFLRIEGIIGKPYVPVLRTIKKLIGQNRLPVDVIALNTENSKLFEGLNSSLNNSSTNNVSSFVMEENSADKLASLCHFQDLEAMYDTMKNEMLCLLCKELKYYYELSFNFGKAAGSTEGQPSQVGLLNSCSTGYMVKPGTFGFLIEKVYQKVGDQGNVTMEAIAEALGIANLLGGDTDGDGIPDNLSGTNAILIGYIVTLFEIPIYIIRLANTFTSNLASFDVDTYCMLQKLLADKASSLKFIFNMFTAGERSSLRKEAFNVMNPVATANTGPSNVIILDSATQPAPAAAPAPASAPTGATNTGFTINTNTNINSANNNNLSAFSSLALTQSNLGKILLLIFLLEDFFDHLDVLIYNCKCSAFKALREEYLKRVAYLTLLRQFGYFTKLHPGIQHKAGVPMGGTFILVYHSQPSRISTGTAQGKFEITGFVKDKTNATIPGATIRVQGTSIATTTNSGGRFRIATYQMPFVLEVGFPGMDTKEVPIFSEEAVTIILDEDETTSTGDSVLNSIADGTVIADFYLPYRCCSDCPPIQYIVKDTEAPPPVNVGPVANAGPDQTITLPINTVTLNGGGSTDADGTIQSFSWAKLSGPAATIATATSSQTDIKDLVQGVYQFELTVTDNKGAIARDTVLVTVNAAAPPPNQAPKADAGPDMTVTLSPTNAVVLNGAGSADPEGGIILFFWRQLSGPSTATINSPNIVQPVLNGLVPGVYEFELMVKDVPGLSSTDTVKVTVEAPPNIAPIANAGGNLGIQLPNNSVTLDGSNSKDPDGTITDFAWKLIQGPNVAITNATSAIATVNGLTEGTYVFELTVKDNAGATNQDKATVTVRKAEVQVQKTCSEFPKIVGLFDALPDVDPTGFARFRELYKPYDNEIVPMFRKFGANGSVVAGLSVDKQIDFFAQLVIPNTSVVVAVVNMGIVEALQKWLAELNDLAVSTGANDPQGAVKKIIRLIVLSLYRVLDQLVLYIVCIQKEDMDKAKIPMDTVLDKFIREHVKNWAANKSQFTADEIKVVKNIGTDMKDEQTRVSANGEAAVKVKYLATLTAIIKIIDTI